MNQKINLKWRNFHQNVTNNFTSLLAEEGLVDVTLASDGRTLKAHKVVLSASSPLFKEIFLKNPCQHPVIVLQDVHYSELSALITFIYKGEINILQEKLPELLKAAEALQISGLSGDFPEEDDINQPTPSPQVLESFPKRQTPLSEPFSTPSVQSATALHVVPCEIIKREPQQASDADIDETMPLDEFPSANVKSKFGPNRDEPFGCMEGIKYQDETGNESAFDLSNASSNFPFPPFPCPFCDRAYTSWGFRRRHIKSCHTRSESLPCKWCQQVAPSQKDWLTHVCNNHGISPTDARNGLLILDEAAIVLQNVQPMRLSSLVNLIKNKETKESGE